MDPLPPDNPTDPLVQRHLEEQRHVAAEQARSWHILYHRPSGVAFAGGAIATLGVLALCITPFVAAYEQMHGYLSVVHREHSVIGFTLLIGIFMTPLGLLINRASNWARWLFALGAGGWIGWSVSLGPVLLHLVPVGIYLALLGMLFNRPANRFFRP